MNNYFLIACFVLAPTAHALTPAEAEKILASANLNPDPNKTIQDNVPALKDEKVENREKAFGTIYQKLMFSYNKRNFPTEDNKQLLSRGLINFYESAPAHRPTIVEALAKYGDNRYAKPFVLKILDGPHQGERDAALRMLGAPGGVSGPEFYEKVRDLADKGLIKPEGRTTMLARVDKDKALAEIIAELRSTKEKERFIYSAWALQDYYRNPDNYKYIVPRIREFGLASDGRIMNKSFRGGSGIGWINADLFSEFVEKAPPKLAKEGFSIMVLDGLLCKPSTVPMLIRMLERKDPEIRLMAAQGLRRAAEYSSADLTSIKPHIKTAIAKEHSEPVRKGLEGELKNIERYEQQWNKAMERLKR